MASFPYKSKHIIYLSRAQILLKKDLFLFEKAFTFNFQFINEVIYLQH